MELPSNLATPSRARELHNCLLSSDPTCTLQSLGGRNLESQNLKTAQILTEFCAPSEFHRTQEGLCISLLIDDLSEFSSQYVNCTEMQRTRSKITTATAH